MKKARWIIFATVLILLFSCLYALNIPSWQKLDMEKITKGSASSIIYDKDGKEAALLNSGKSAVKLTGSEIPDTVKNAFIACEDKKFYDHKGIDVKRIFGALLNNIRSASIEEGASTITQQLIKLTHLSNEKRLSRKANEAYLAIQLERKITKDEILTHYLNTVYFGKGAYGIESASKVYFSKSAKELTLSEAALLAGIIKAPSRYSPDVNMKRAVERRNYVLNRMFEDGYITSTQKDSAVSESVKISNDANAGEFSWYKDYVIDEATENLKISADELLSGGYRIHTYLDPERQVRAERLFKEDALFPAESADGTKAESAFIAIDSLTGGIRAIVGGREYTAKRGFNRASDAYRQPGSALKPVSVYAAAIDGLGMSPSSILDDSKRVFDGGYEPRNAGDSYNGLVTVREALSRSLNVASVSLIEFTGIERAREYAKRFGLPLSKSDSGLSLALGSLTDGVTPLMLSGAYASLSNGGTRVQAHAISKIIDRNGRTVYEDAKSSVRVITEESAFMLTSILKDAAKTGSARALKDVKTPVAAKTGTVSMDEGRNRDAWTCAYTTDISAVIWMGFDETDENHALAAAEGGSFAAKFMCEFMKEETGEAFKMPDGIKTARIDKNELIQNKRVYLAPDNAPDALIQHEIFLKGKEPKTISPLFLAPLKPDAPEISVSRNEIHVRIHIKDENHEYILISDTDGEKEAVAIVSGQKGETKELTIARDRHTKEYFLIARNRVMHENGLTLLSEESDRVVVDGNENLLSIFEDIIKGR